MDSYMGTILMWAMNWAPRGWAICDGSLLSISQNTAFFSLIGTTYGGNGTTTFALPDLRGRMPIGMGQGPGLTPRTLAQQFGNENTQLTDVNMPSHTHTLTASTTASTSLSPTPAANWTLGAPGTVTGDRPPVVTPVNMYTSTPSTAVPSAPTSAAGGSAPFGNMPPALCVNYIICVEGVYPTRP